MAESEKNQGGNSLIRKNQTNCPTKTRFLFHNFTTFVKAEAISLGLRVEYVRNGDERCERRGNADETNFWSSRDKGNKVNI